MCTDTGVISRTKAEDDVYMQITSFKMFFNDNLLFHTYTMNHVLPLFTKESQLKKNKLQHDA